MLHNHPSTQRGQTARHGIDIVIVVLAIAMLLTAIPALSRVPSTADGAPAPLAAPAPIAIDPR